MIWLVPRKETRNSLLAAPRNCEVQEKLLSQEPPKRIPLWPLLLPLAITIFLAPLSVPQSHAEKSGYQGAPLQPELASPSVERRVDALLKQMNLDEKTGQLVQYSVGTPTGPGTGRGNYEEMVQKGEVGSLFNVAGVQSANHIQLPCCTDWT
jgi:hypothetical protein